MYKYNIGDVVSTKASPKILGYIVDIIILETTNAKGPVYAMFFEDSDAIEWVYKEDEYEIVTDKRYIGYMKRLFEEWSRDANV